MSASVASAPQTGAGREVILAARSVSVDFPGTRAVDDVSLEIRAGEVLALVGANGSGKTTLLSVLCGLRRPTAGRLEDGDGEVVFRSPGDALARGITLVPQEPQLAVTMSCWENVALGHPSALGFSIANRQARARARHAVSHSLPHIDPSARADTLRKADRAILALLAALARRPRLLALDEPTAVLGEQAVGVVSRAIEQVGEDGGAVILVSHRLRDIVALATRVVVLVDGRATFETEKTSDLTVDALVEQLTHGRIPKALAERDGTARAASAAAAARPPLLAVTELATADGLHIDRLDVRPGEIVGLAGLAGSGRSRLLRVLTGATPVTAGRIELEGKPFPRSIRSARRAGVAYVAEDRAADGMFAPLTVARNLTIGQLVAKRPLFSRASRLRERGLARSLIERYAIRAPHLYALITTLSGGNQQRVMLGRALAGDAKLLLADEPTQGVDVNGREEIQELMTAFAARGGGVVVSSSDFEELLGLCTRIVVMRDGTTLGELAPDETDYRALVGLTSGAHLEIEPQVIGGDA